MMTFKQVYKNFTPSIKDNFPVDDCVQKSEFSENIFHSYAPYLCLIIDTRFKECWELAILYPYLYKESKENIYFGWIDKNGNTRGNIENSIHILDDFVVGFQKYENDGFEALWNKFINKIDSQFDS